LLQEALPVAVRLLLLVLLLLLPLAGQQQGVLALLSTPVAVRGSGRGLLSGAASGSNMSASTGWW
jgi:hypothetical protein